MLQDRVMAHILGNVVTRFCKGKQLAALMQCGPAGQGFGGLVQQLQNQSPEPLVWTVEVDSDRAMNRIELNRMDHL